jgi:uncharacterized membrane protein YfcA
MDFIIIVLLLGLGVGIFAGLLGVGGGIVLIPALVYLLEMSQHLAQGTSMLLLLPPLGLGALFFYWRKGQVDLRAGIACAAGFLVGGYFGSLVAIEVSSEHLRGMFGVFLMFAALMLLKQGRAPAPPQTEEAGDG